MHTPSVNPFSCGFQNTSDAEEGSCDISGSYSDEYEGGYFLGCSAV
jgi:hypothetical protein